MKTKTLRAGVLLSLFAPLLAQAHEAGAHAHSSFLSGLIHPLTGLDHVAMLLAVGFWAANQKSITPVLFVFSALCGAALAYFGVNLPWVETGILASLGLMGALMLLGGRVHVRVAQAAIAVFAGLHGFAHGLTTLGEATSEAVAYGAGFSISMAALIYLSRAVTTRFHASLGQSRVIACTASA